MKITLFSGGRGNKNLITELSKLDKTAYDIRIIINGYDDGLSTGELRDYLGNILGPSDFRKCISYLGKNTDIVKLCDYRLPVGSTRSDFQKFIETVSNETGIFFSIFFTGRLLFSEKENSGIKGYPDSSRFSSCKRFAYKIIRIVKVNPM